MGRVKGVARQIILVRSPDRRLFEQAIFIVREQVSLSGIGPEQILEEAQRAANGYIRRTKGAGRLLHRVPAPLLLAIGAGSTGLAWLITWLL